LLYNKADYDALHHFVKERLADLDSTFMSAITMWDTFNWTTVVEGDISKNCLKRDLDWI